MHNAIEFFVYEQTFQSFSVCSLTAKAHSSRRMCRQPWIQTILPSRYMFVQTKHDKIDRMVRKSKRSDSWMNLPEKRHLNCASAVSCTFRLSVRLESIALIWHEFHVNNVSYQLTLIVCKKTIFSHLCKTKMPTVFAFFHLNRYHFKCDFFFKMYSLHTYDC